MVSPDPVSFPDRKGWSMPCPEWAERRYIHLGNRHIQLCTYPGQDSCTDAISAPGPGNLAGWTIIMGQFIKKYGLLKKSCILAIILGFIRIAIDYGNLDFLAVSPVITGLIAGVMFTIAVIFTGTLTDYKESEKIPGDLATSFNSLYTDICMIPAVDQKTLAEYQENVRELYQIMVHNFKTNAWDQEPVQACFSKINGNILEFAEQNAAPPILVKLRNELASIDRMSNRVKQIHDTGFIPAAYALAEIAIAFVLLVLLFIKSESGIDSVILLMVITVITTGLIFLIQDMDDPFEVGTDSNADVDLFLLFDLEKYLK
jgi:hypothetical protein